MTIAVVPTVASASNLIYMLDMSIQLDEQDRHDFQGALKKASECTLARRFSCSEEQLREASRLANGAEDKLAFDSTRIHLQERKQRVEQEALANAERERQLRLAEKRREEGKKAEVQAKVSKHEQAKVREKVEKDHKYLRGTITAVSTLLGSVLNGPVQLMLMGFAMNGILDSSVNEYRVSSNNFTGDGEREQYSGTQ